MEKSTFQDYIKHFKIHQYYNKPFHPTLNKIAHLTCIWNNWW